jgi:hypothetical protein
MSRIICCIEKDNGMYGVCGMEAMGETDINCKKCVFYKMYKGKEKEYFSWTKWTGDII